MSVSSTMFGFLLPPGVEESNTATLVHWKHME